MATTKYFIQSGFIVKKYDENPDDTNLFSLDKWLKRKLTQWGVTFADPCCPTTTTTSTSAPTSTTTTTAAPTTTTTTTIP